MLSRNGATKRQWVHRLVLSAFTGPCPPGMECCHNDGDPSNNRPENLRWDTRSSNARDKRVHGTDPNASRTLCRRSHKLSDPNLVVNPDQTRECRACQRAIGGVKRARKLDRIWTESEIKARADMQYSRIMPGEWHERRDELIEAVRVSADLIRATTPPSRDVIEQRKSAIRAAYAHGVRCADFAGVSGLGKVRIYQIIKGK